MQTTTVFSQDRCKQKQVPIVYQNGPWAVTEVNPNPSSWEHRSLTFLPKGDSLPLPASFSVLGGDGNWIALCDAVASSGLMNSVAVRDSVIPPTEEQIGEFQFERDRLIRVAMGDEADDDL